MSLGTHQETSRPVRVLLCGACLSGNMGGQALYVSMVESLRQRADDVRVTVLSKYPADDQASCDALGWRLVPFPTRVQLLYGVPFSLLCGLLRLLGLPCRWLAGGPFAAYRDNDVLIDLSGISFTDDRPLSGLIINCLWLMPAVAMGLPYVKASQAMGPFTRPLVRIAARFFLSRAAGLVARGAASAGFVRALLPSRTVYELPDAAFVLEPAPEAEMTEVLESVGLRPGDPYCVVGPSTVVDHLMARARSGGSYPDLMAKAVDKLIDLSGHNVLLVPHERAHTASSADDLEVCLATLERVVHREHVKVVKRSCSASVLKGILSRAEVAVGSRFHFMVAALSSGVPGAAIAWSHKYYEMMHMLGQERFAISYEDLEEAVLVERIHQLWEARGLVRGQLAERLPKIKERAAFNATIALDTVAASEG
jgi:polysaccharide pyruvyl transferase WcaK-like protein